MIWCPQAGPQALACVCPADLVLFGGARKGGKSDTSLGRHLIGAQRFGRHWSGLMIRRNYKDFLEMRKRIDELIGDGLAAERIGGDNQANDVRFANGASVRLVAMGKATDADDYQGSTFCEITVEEAGTMAYIHALLDRLRALNVSPHGIKCTIFLTANPGGAGQTVLKQLFMDPADPMTIFTEPTTGESRCYIPSRVSDNRLLLAKDPKVLMRLAAISDPILRRAWLEGDWSAVVGQAFAWDRQWHILPECPPIPQFAPLMMTFDYGFGAPFSIGWWWIDPEGRLVRFGEWYGWNGVPNEGLRLTDSQIAEGIVERERMLGISGRAITRLSGPDCFSKKADYVNGQQAPSTADVFAKFNLHLAPGNPSRVQKLRQFRQRLHIERDEAGGVTCRPMLVVYPTCEQFIRTIPTLWMSPENPEDLDDSQEDHVYDEACHAVMTPASGASLKTRAPTKWQKPGEGR